jgi:hypothetical protein
VIIDLHDPSQIPQNLRHRLEHYRQAFLQKDWLEQIEDAKGFEDIKEELANWLAGQHVRTYHCTRVPSLDYFAANELRALNRVEHQREFLEKFGSYFTAQERSDMQKAWDAYFRGIGERCRNGLVWVCASKGLVKSNGTERFFTYFGGEAIYWAIPPDSSAAQKLKTLGQPAVVEMVLPVADFAYTASPFSMAMLSYYHHSLNSSAHLYESEGYLKRNIRISEIVRTTALADFD